MSITFDTLQYVKDLQEAGVPEKQAVVQAKKLSEVLTDRENLYKEKLASKQDIHDLSQEMKHMELKLKVWFSALLLAQAGVIVALLKLIP